MTELDTDYFARCIAALEQAHATLNRYANGDLMYDIYRAACVKEFEIILEQTGKLTKKWLRPYFASSAAVDRLTFKDVFRHAARHGLIALDETERWLTYRDYRNDTAHEYGEDFANAILAVLPTFIQDAARINQRLMNCDDPAESA